MKPLSTGKQILYIVAVSLVVSIIAAFVHPKRPSWYRVASAEELRWQIGETKAKELLETSEVLLIDAREREKFEKAHLNGAILLNLGEWSDLMFQHMETLQDAFERPVLVYCDTQTCGKSHEIAKRLRELIGLDPVYVLFGDWRALENSQSP